MNFNMKFFFKYICTVLILSSCVSSKHLAPVVDKSNINYQELETNESSKELIIAEYMHNIKEILNLSENDSIPSDLNYLLTIDDHFN